MDDFQTLKTHYDNNEFQEIIQHSRGKEFLKLRSISRSKLLQKFAQENSIDISKAPPRKLLEFIFNQKPSEGKIESFINSVYQEERNERKHNEDWVYSQLYKLESFDWGGLYQNSLEQSRKEIGSWVIGYWIPKQNFEVNVWNCFKNRYNRIFKAKKEQFKINSDITTVSDVSEWKNGNVLLVNTSALEFLKTLKENSLDYIITDPPHGDRQPYLELSLMWNSWLGFQPDFEKELVVSDAKSRDKTVANYNLLFKSILLEISRVLKPEKKFTLIFNSLDDKAWLSIIEIIHHSDLELIEISTMAYSANSVIQDNRKRGLETDFVLNFSKTSKKLPKLHTLNETEEIFEIITLINAYKSNHEEFRSYELLNYIIISMLKKGLSFHLSIILQQIEKNS